MIPLYTNEQFESSKGKEKFPLQCKNCNKTFYKTKHYIKTQVLNPNRNATGDFCSPKCLTNYFNKQNDKLPKIVTCIQCEKKFSKRQSQVKKSQNHFCSQSCAATYNNTNRKTGTRISKLELYIQDVLVKKYPNLEFHFNRKDAINSELDIYIPSLKLAFELNGIFHYEPIYGKDKLSQIQNNDHRKFSACAENQISLCIIDTSSQKRFTEKSSQKFVDIICNHIEQLL